MSEEHPVPCHNVGLQWGFWKWSDSQYAWVGGAGAGAPPTPPPEHILTDDFNDNSIDTDKWEDSGATNNVTTGSGVFEQNQRMEVIVGSGTGSWERVWRYGKPLIDFSSEVVIEIDAVVVPNVEGKEWVLFGLWKEKSSSPNTADHIRISATKPSGESWKIRVMKYISGSGTGLGEADVADPTGSFEVHIDSTTIRVIKDDTEIINVNHGLTFTSGYFAFYSTTNLTSNNTTALDNLDIYQASS